MALSRVKTWTASEVLTAADLNGEFNNILNNALSAISPLTGTLNANLFQVTNLLFETQSANQTAATEGRVYYQTTEDQIHVDDGTNIRRVPTIASVTRGDLIRATAANQWARLALPASGRFVQSDGTDIAGSAYTLPTAAPAAGSFLRSDGTNFASSTLLLGNAALTNGQLIIGSTGVVPVAATLTAGTGITVTNAAGSITVAATSALPGVVRGAVGVTGSTTTYTFTGADFIAFYNPTSGAIESMSTAQGSLTNTITTSGPAANGRDQSGAFTASSWVYFYYIRGSGQTNATVSSAVAPPTGPTLPTNYTSWAFIAAFRVDGSTLLINTYLRGNKVYYQSQQNLFSNLGNGTFASKDASAIIPPQASSPSFDAQVKAAGGAAIDKVRLSLDGTNEFAVVGDDNTTASPLLSVVWGMVHNIPNISQAIYAASNSASDLASMWITSYEVANGG